MRTETLYLHFTGYSYSLNLLFASNSLLFRLYSSRCSCSYRLLLVIWYWKDAVQLIMTLS